MEVAWTVSLGCLEGIYGMYEWYVGCLDVSDGQVRTGQVRIGQVRTGQVRTGQVRTGQVSKGQVRILRTG